MVRTRSVAAILISQFLRLKSSETLCQKKIQCASMISHGIFQRVFISGEMWRRENELF